MKYSDKEFGLSYYSRDRRKGNLIKWIETDSREAFIKNTKLYPDNPSIKYYLENPITYNLNDYGFRTPDNFDSKHSGNIFLGCSHTFGTGHYLENTWSYKLNREIGGKFWNLSAGGSSYMYAFRIFMHYIDKLKADNVFFFGPHKTRYEYYDKGEWNFIIPSSMTELNPEYSITKTVMSDHTAFSISNMVLKSIAYECNKRNINFYYLKNFPRIEKKLTPNSSSDKELIEARDLIHKSVSDQHSLFERFLYLYQSKKTFKKMEKTLELFASSKKKSYI